MPPRIKCVVLSLGLAALVVGCEHSSNISKEPEHGIANGKMESMLASMPDPPVHTIVMPHDEPLFPPGAGRDDFVTACVVCHSPRYITMQPQFSRTTWLSEVKKMKDVYGAHISDDQVLKITDYLVSINGKPDTGRAPEGTYGE
jgi:sulfite dehydrogenase (cytochrome) subunit B